MDDQIPSCLSRAALGRGRYASTVVSRGSNGPRREPGGFPAAVKSHRPFALEARPDCTRGAGWPLPPSASASTFPEASDIAPAKENAAGSASATPRPSRLITPGILRRYARTVFRPRRARPSGSTSRLNMLIKSCTITFHVKCAAFAGHVPLPIRRCPQARTSCGADPPGSTRT